MTMVEPRVERIGSEPDRPMVEGRVSVEVGPILREPCRPEEVGPFIAALRVVLREVRIPYDAWQGYARLLDNIETNTKIHPDEPILWGLLESVRKALTSADCWPDPSPPSRASLENGARTWIMADVELDPDATEILQRTFGADALALAVAVQLGVATAPQPGCWSCTVAEYDPDVPYVPEAIPPPLLP